MAEGLVILTGGSRKDLLGTGYAFLSLAEDDPRLKRLCLPLLRAMEAEEDGAHAAALKYDREFIRELLRLTQ